MAWIRYIVYFASIVAVTWALMQMELASPGSLKLHILVDDADILGTSEYSPIEIIQAIILGSCGVIMAWVARFCPSQRPIAFLFGGMALIFLIRELDYFFDRFLADNLWQALVVIAAALVVAYIYRHRLRLRIALARIWPSPGLTFLFCGAVILFAIVWLVGHELLWMSILGDDYRRVIKIAVERSGGKTPRASSERKTGPAELSSPDQDCVTLTRQAVGLSPASRAVASRASVS
jgi:hypothetical protein